MTTSTSTATPATTAANAPRRRRTGPLGAINDDWDRQYAHQGTTDPATGDWATTHPALTGYRTVTDVLHTLQTPQPHPGHHDAVLWALLALQHDGCALAGRTVLQATLGLLPRLSRVVASRQVDDADSVAVAALWQAITGYPLRRTARVASNLRLEALSLLEAPVPRGENPVFVPMWDELDVITTEQEQLEDGAGLLTWGQQTGVITTDEARLLARVYLSEHRAALTGVADEFGCSYPAIRQRLSVTTRRLATAVNQALTAGGI